ncbi:serine/arginine repetitive matrix protein 1 [Oryza brachyantha]|uniref:PWI domain-containing protein n=1 Tax=Oryza brachyantha TaxID=4533 RepID=J3LME2_ORYBR|nr:serine/arginine repetitive matrix protein 1 [Oryza brachyantha]
MSGGFFRGTSADQDTRFSNKQAKLLKTQKFAPELEHLVDMTKVKMDVMKPWIATRVTELLGFEDEVLINFIYGLLEEKEADGKKIQIQLTGFMEKNTVKFMKELWSLLLSAQQNASGVPQQFLDAKEAEIQQKKAEESRIAQEIQKKREKDGRDQELENQKLMDGDAGNSRLGPDCADAEEEKELNSKHSSRTKSRESHRSRSISLSPRGRRRSISPRRRSPSPSRHSISFERTQRSSRRSISPRRSFSPRRRSPRSTPSVSRRRSPYSRRSPSVPRYRSPSPRRRHHIRRKSPPFGRRRSPSPHHRQSPGRGPRSPSPARHRSSRRRLSQDKHRSPSPGRRRPRPPSPGRRRPRSPSPGRRMPRSPSPRRHRPRSRSPGRQRSPSPHRSPRLRSPKRRRRSPVSPRSRCANHRASPQRMRSSSRDIEKGTNGVPSRNDVDVLQRNKERSRDDNRNDTEVSDHFSSDSEQRKLTKSTSSPNKPERNSARDSSVKRTEKHLPSQGITDTSGEEEDSRARENVRKANSSHRKVKDFSADLQLMEAHDDLSHGEKSPSRFQQSGKETSKKLNNQLSESSEDERDGRRKQMDDSPDDSHMKQHSPSRAGMHNSYSKDAMNNEYATKGSRDGISAKKYPAKVDEDPESEDGSSFKKDKRKVHGNSHIDSGSSGSEESGKHRSHAEKRKHKKTRKHKRHYDDSSDESDSESDDKESKRRRKEEKRLRKEERRRRREERHRRRADRHASKLKLKHAETVDMDSDAEKDHDSDSDADVRKKGLYTGKEESDQQKLEIELREKALESLRAKKAINH